jgi:hypothetical protein
MKAYRVVGVQIHVSLNSPLDGIELLALRYNRFSLGIKHSVPLVWKAWWVPESVWLKRRRENSCPKRDSNSDPGNLCTDFCIPDPISTCSYSIVSIGYSLCIFYDICETDPETFVLTNDNVQRHKIY